jgi:integrase
MSDEYDRALHMPPRRTELTQRDMTRPYIRPSRRKFINDTLVPGFALMLTPTGHRSLVFRFRFGGRTDKITFRTTSVEEARKLASAARGTLQSGDNPRFREPTKSGKTLREVITEYLRQQPSDYKSAQAMWACFENHAQALLGRPIESLTRDITVPVVDAVMARHATRRRAGRFGANALAKNLNTIGHWYAKRSHNFAWWDVPSPLPKRDRAGRDRVLDDHEIAAVWNAAARQGYPHGTFIQFLLLTSLRRTEAAQLRRAEVVNGVMRLPPERTKNKEPFTLPLSAAAADLLASCPDGEWYFVGTRAGEPYSTFTHGKDALDKLTNVPHWTLHDLRRTAATLMERAGVLPHVIEATLNHKVRGVGGVYRRHNFVDEKRQAMEALANLVREIVGETTHGGLA